MSVVIVSYITDILFGFTLHIGMVLLIEAVLLIKMVSLISWNSLTDILVGQFQRLQTWNVFQISLSQLTQSDI